MDLREEIPKLLNGNYDGVSARLRFLEYDWQAKGLDVQGRFYYLAFKDGRPSVDDFVQVLWDQVIPFCIPAPERNELLEEFNRTGNYHYLMQLYDKARRLFIKAKDKAYISGEPGEVILFLLLESFLKAPQIACKMYLKTNSNMPVHGSDGIHIQYDGNRSVLTLFWGESKLYEELSSALDAICGSISAFTNEIAGESPRKRDLDVLTGHMSVRDGELKEELKKYFNPYKEYSNMVEERFACLAGFDYSVLSSLDSLDRNQLEEQFRQKYLSRIESACELFASKIRNSGLQRLKFVFLLIPFESVDEVRDKFLGNLGVQTA